MPTEDWIGDFVEHIAASSKDKFKYSLHAGSDIEIASHVPFGIPTRVPGVDLSIGRPGFPAGRIVEVFGFEGCLRGDSFILFTVRYTDGQIWEPWDGGESIEGLYERFHKYPGSYYAPCMGPDGRISAGKIVDVVQSGVKECYRVTAETGKGIFSTLDHKYAVAPDKFVPLSELRVGDTILIRDDSTSLLASPSRILNIERSHKSMTYDIKMEGPHNFISNGFIVHNSGKSCLGLAECASAQRLGGHAIWIDAESCWDPDWAELNGCDPDNITVAEADSVESIFTVIERGVHALKKMDGQVPFVFVVDSVTAVPSHESLEKDLSDVERIGTDARAIRRCLRRLARPIAESNAMVMFINHQVANLDGGKFAKPLSAGGNAMKFYSSIRLQMSRVSDIQKTEKGKKVYDGINVRLTVRKNKVGHTAEKATDAQLMHNGFDLYHNLFSAFESIGVLKSEKGLGTKYRFTPKDIILAKNEWRGFVDEHTNGIDEAYKWFLAEAETRGLIKPYGVVK